MKMGIYQVRVEENKDFDFIQTLIQFAFADAEYSDHQEHFLVQKLRTDTAFLPNLALVACDEQGNIVGHIMFSEAIVDKTKVLALAPLSIAPTNQNQGIGTTLINVAHEQIKKLDYPCVVVLGHPNYYAKFGYESAEKFGIQAPFEVPEGALRVLLLTNDIPKGVIEYARAFF